MISFVVDDSSTNTYIENLFAVLRLFLYKLSKLFRMIHNDNENMQLAQLVFDFDPLQKRTKRAYHLINSTIEKISFESIKIRNVRIHSRRNYNFHSNTEIR